MEKLASKERIQGDIITIGHFGAIREDEETLERAGNNRIASAWKRSRYRVSNSKIAENERDH